MLVVTASIAETLHNLAVGFCSYALILQNIITTRKYTSANKLTNPRSRIQMFTSLCQDVQIIHMLKCVLKLHTLNLIRNEEDCRFLDSRIVNKHL